MINKRVPSTARDSWPRRSHIVDDPGWCRYVSSALFTGGEGMTSPRQESLGHVVGGASSPAVRDEARGPCRKGLSRVALTAVLVVLIAWVGAPAAQARPSTTDPTDTAWLSAQVLDDVNLPGYAPQAAKALGPGAVLGGVGSYYDRIRAVTAVGGYQRQFLNQYTRSILVIRLEEATSHGWAVSMTNNASLTRTSPDAIPPGTVFGTEKDPRWQQAQVGRFIKGRISVTVRLLSSTSAPVPSPALVDVVNRQYKRLDATGDLTSDRVISGRPAQTSLLLGLVGTTVGGVLLVSLLTALGDRGTRDAFLWALSPERRRRLESLDGVEVLIDAVAYRRRRHRRRVRWRIAFFVALFVGVYYAPLGFTKSLIIGLGLIWLGMLVHDVRAQRRSTVAGSVPVGVLALVLSACANAVILGLVGAAAEAVFVVVALQRAAPDAAAQRQAEIFYTVALLATLAVAVGLDRLTRRLNARRAHRTLALDERPEVVFLRSFGDDVLSLRTSHRGERSLVQRLTLQNRETLEQLIAWAAWRHGPVVAVGEPGTHLPPLGATRAYYPDDRWQEEVARRIEASAAVVLIAGRTRGLAWEIGHVARLGALSKLVVLFPPLPRPELQRRHRIVCGALGLDHRKSPGARSAVGDLIALGFDAEGAPVFTVVDGRDDTAYLAAIDVSLRRIAGQPDPPVHHVSARFASAADADWERELLKDVRRPGAVKRLWQRRGGRLAAVGMLCLWGLDFALHGITSTIVPLPGHPVAATQGVFGVSESGTVLATDPRRGVLQLFREAKAGGTAKLDGSVTATSSVGETVYFGEVGKDLLVAYDAAGSRPVQLWSDPLEAAPLCVVANETHIAALLYGRDQVVIADRITGKIRTTVATGHTPTGVAFHDGRLLVTTAGDRLWTEYDVATGTRLASGPLPAAATDLVVRGEDLYFAALGNSQLVHYSLRDGAVVAKAWLNGMGNVAFGRRSAMVGVDTPSGAVVMVDLATMKVRSVTPTPSTTDSPAWAAGNYYMTFSQDADVVELAGS